MVRSKRSSLWTGHMDQNGVLIMVGDKVHQVGIRSGCYNNENRVITVHKHLWGLYADGYYSDQNTVVTKGIVETRRE